MGKNKITIIFIGIVLILLIALSIFIRPKINFNHKIPSKKIEPAFYDNYKYLLPHELREKIVNQEPLAILDMRDAMSYQNKHIENSINISNKNLSDNIKTLSKDILIVIVSYNYDNKKETATVIGLLKEFGFKNIVILSGGITGWKNDNNPLIGEGDPTSSVDVSKVEYLLPEQVKLAVDNDYPVFIIDARPKLFFLNGHLPGAINIPLADLEKRQNEILINNEIVIYARDELEDFNASVKLYDLGFLANYIIKGGFNSWQKKGFTIEK